MLFGNGKGHVNRIDLIDDDQSGAVIEANQVSFVDQQAANPPIDRRINIAIAQLNFSVLDGRFICIDDGFRRIRVGLI